LTRVDKPVLPLRPRHHVHASQLLDGDDDDHAALLNDDTLPLPPSDNDDDDHAALLNDAALPPPPSDNDDDDHAALLNDDALPPSPSVNGSTQLLRIHPASPATAPAAKVRIHCYYQPR